MSRSRTLLEKDTDATDQDSGAAPGKVASLVELLADGSERRRVYQPVADALLGRGRPIRAALVSPAEPDEGPMVTFHVAATLAGTGRSVVLVEAEGQVEGFGRLLGQENHPGLADLSEDGAAAPLLLATDIPNLTLVPFGPPTANRSAVLTGEPFQRFLEELRSRFDLILFRTGPVLPVGEPLLLAPLVDGILLLVRAEQTEMDRLARAKTMIQEKDTELLGVILTGRSYPIPRWLYRLLFRG